MPAPDPRLFLEQFAAAAEPAGFHRHNLAATPAGPVTAWERPGPRPPVYLSAGIHGDEPAGPIALLELLRGGALDPLDHCLLCPLLNPTGIASGRRDNDDGIDLNRDYLRRRTAEVAAHAAWLESRPVPAMFLSLHEDWETSGFYLYEINLGPDSPQRARRILDAVAPWFEPEPGPSIDDHQVREPGWIYHAADADLPGHWPEAIFLAKRGCPLSFTLESPSRADFQARVAAHVAAVNSVLGQSSKMIEQSRPMP